MNPQPALSHKAIAEAAEDASSIAIYDRTHAVCYSRVRETVFAVVHSTVREAGYHKTLDATFLATRNPLAHVIVAAVEACLPKEKP